MTQVAFTVAGVPAPQGSKVRTKWGMREANAATRPWREAVAWNATAAMTEPPFDGEVELTAWFFFPRPKSHHGTGRNAGVLKASAPDHMASKPDLDKLLRALCDGMTGIVYRDDSQVVAVAASKRYGPPRVDVTVRLMRARRALPEVSSVMGGD